MREQMFNGINLLNNAVKITLGPKGRNVIIGDCHVTKDGISVAKEVKSENKLENTGIQLVRNACSKTCDDAGDGTTTSVVLAQAIIQQGLQYLAAGVDPYEIRDAINKDVDAVKQFIFHNKIEADLEKVKQIATISANNDSFIGNLIAEAYEKVGKNGVITMEENKGSDTYVKVVEGLQIQRGFTSPYFINNSDAQTCELENVTIYSHKGNISDFKDILPILEDASVNRKSVLILTENIEPEILDTIIINRIQNHLKVCVVKVPFEQLVDITFANKVVISNSITTIIAPNTQAKVAVLYVGASTAVELLEKKDRVEDAICAVKSALEEGIVSGGGFTYLQASQHLSEGIIKNALQKPAEQIAENAGQCGKLIVEKAIESGLGYNAKTNTFSNLIEDGIVDPAKVARVALENAASVANMFFLTECVL